VGPSRKCAATPRRSRGLAAASDTPRLAGYQQCSSCLVGSCACQACPLSFLERCRDERREITKTTAPNSSCRWIRSRRQLDTNPWLYRNPVAAAALRAPCCVHSTHTNVTTAAAAQDDHVRRRSERIRMWTVQSFIDHD
jgi:hypothetical protein